MNAVSTEEKAAILAHYTNQATMARAAAKKRGKTMTVTLSGRFECEVAYDTVGGIFVNEICFDGVHWIDPAEFLLPSAIALIEADIEDTLREFGE